MNEDGIDRVNRMQRTNRAVHGPAVSANPDDATCRVSAFSSSGEAEGISFPGQDIGPEKVAVKSWKRTSLRLLWPYLLWCWLVVK